jgi:RNA 3'-terminal phosphate cyclase (ATP)
LTVGHLYETGAVGASSNATRQIKSEPLAQQAMDEVLGWALTASSIDPILAEHVLIPAILADSDTEFRVSVLTKRFLTIVWVIKQFVPVRITVQGSEGQSGHVKIRRASESS